MTGTENRLREDRAGKRARVKPSERAVLVGADIQDSEYSEPLWDVEESMEELASLCKTAGLHVLSHVVQRITKPDPAYFIGQGKAEEIGDRAQQLDADVVIFNDELSPAQARNLEDKIELKIVDRAQLILDIFAQRASTKEAKLQVELAQLEYLLPRLRGWGEALERLGGGIGTRGPGETRLEQDRQKVQLRIESIQEKLEQASQEWAIRRKRRAKRGIPEIALMGYTNTGKTTLLNTLSGSEGFVEDKLFATLDPLTRKVELPDQRKVLFIDTVGLIRKLPHQLIPAFRSTLKSARNSSLILNVMDATKGELPARFETVHRTLTEDVFEDADNRPPVINVLNKVDSVHDQSSLQSLSNRIDNSVQISAKEGENIERLQELIAEKLGDEVKQVTAEFTYSQADLVEWFHKNGSVDSEEYERDHIKIEGQMEQHLLTRLKRKADGGLNLQIV